MVRSEFIKSLRETLSLSVKDVESRARLPAGTLSEIEAGAHDPTIDELESIARTLGLRGETLFDEQVASSAPSGQMRSQCLPPVGGSPSS